MARDVEPHKFDPFARAVPGQSWAEEPGLHPYERPPMSVDPEEVIAVLQPALKEEQTSQELSDLLDIGISCETVSEALMQKTFTEGMCTPDVAELVKPAVFMVVAQIGYDNNISDMVLFNDEGKQDQGFSDEEKVDMMEKMNPKKYAKLMETVERIDMERDEVMGESPEFQSDLVPDEGMSEQAPLSDASAVQGQGSFIDMEIPQNQEDEFEDFDEVEETEYEDLEEEME